MQEKHISRLTKEIEILISSLSIVEVESMFLKSSHKKSSNPREFCQTFKDLKQTLPENRKKKKKTQKTKKKKGRVLARLGRTALPWYQNLSKPSYGHKATP